MTSDAGEATSDLTDQLTIGQIVTRWPGTMPVITRYFHGGCHHCPSQHVEPLWLAAKLYGLPVDYLLQELRAAMHQPPVESAPALTARQRRLIREKSGQQS